MAWIAGLAMLALLATGWRKTARAHPRPPRDPLAPKRVPFEVTHVVTEPYRSPNPVRRLWAGLASGGLAIVLGAVLATIVAYALAILVTTLTELLRQ